MRLARIEAENFLGYPSLDILIPAKGAVAVLGLNGTGKSCSVVETVCWALYGRTVRELRADGVCYDSAQTGKGKGTMVRLTLVDGDKGWTVERYRKHKVYKNAVFFGETTGHMALNRDLGAVDDKGTTAKIADRIGASWEVFSLVNVFGQGMISRFATAKDSERAEILDDLLGTGGYARARNVCRARLAEAGLRKTREEQARETIEAKIRWELAAVDQAQQSSTAWIVDRALKVEGQAQAIKLIEQEIARATLQLQPFVDRQTELDAAVKAAEEAEAAAAAATAQLRLAATFAWATVETTRKAWHTTQADVDRQVAAAAQLRRLIDVEKQSREQLISRATSFATRSAAEAQSPVNICASCGIDLPAAAEAGLYSAEAAANLIVTRDNKVEELEAFGEKLLDQAMELSQKIGRMEAQHDADCGRAGQAAQTASDNEAAFLQARKDAGAADLALQAAIAATAHGVQVARTGVAMIRGQVQSATLARSMHERNLADANKRLAAAAAVLAQHQAAVDPYPAEVAKHKAAADACRADTARFETTLATLAQEVEDLQFWDRAFSPAGIRNLLLDQVIPQLNDAAARYSARLGGRVQVAFSAVGATAAGDARDRFTVSTTVLRGAGDYGGSSGGQKRLADLIQLLAVRSVAAQSRSGLQYLVLDEPFEALDSDAMGAVVELIREEEANLDGAVLLLTHQDELRDSFPTRWQASRTDGVSTLVTSC